MQPIEVTRREKLAQLIKEAGSQTALSDRTGKAPAQISQWLNASANSSTGKPRVISNAIARELELRMGKPAGWMDQPTDLIGTVSTSIVPAYHAPDAVLVPILANGASMGGGESLLESDVIVGDIALSPHWINQYIRPQNPRELRFIHAYGDSMAPTFTDGDVLLVDTGSGARDPHSREGVYVLQADGRNYVKRVTPTFDGKLQVTSDNPSSKTVQILNGEHQVEVLGRVVWAWNGKKL